MRNTAHWECTKAKRIIVVQLKLLRRIKKLNKQIKNTLKNLSEENKIEF